MRVRIFLGEWHLKKSETPAISDVLLIKSRLRNMSSMFKPLILPL